MFRRLERFASELLVRTPILVGTLFACDGAQKLLVVFGGVPEGSPAAIVWIGGAIELLGGALIAGRSISKAHSDVQSPAFSPVRSSSRR